MSAPLESSAGAYFLVAHDSQAGEWLVVGVLVATDHAWVVGRFDAREVAEQIAAEWTALDEVAA